MGLLPCVATLERCIERQVDGSLSIKRWKGQCFPHNQKQHPNPQQKQARSSVENYLEMNKMISTEKLIQIARKWQKMAAKGRKRIAFQRTNSKSSSANANRSSAAQKGRFVVYTTDERRFAIPLSYLSNTIVRELFRESEEEFGIPRGGPITLPVDALSMEYIISLISRGLAKDQENALLLSLTRRSCSSCSAFSQALESPQILVCS